MSTPLADKSSTKSSKFVTSNTLLSTLKGIGPKISTSLSARGLETVGDFLYFFPKRYEFEVQNLAVSQLQAGQRAQLSLEIISARKIRTRTGKTFFEAHARDARSSILLKWFYFYPSLEKRIFPGSKLKVTGEIKEYKGMLEIVHPELGPNVSDLAESSFQHSSSPAQEGAHSGSLTPQYPEIEGLHPIKLRKWIEFAFKVAGTAIRDDLPSPLLEKHQFPQLSQALKDLHYPDPKSDLNELNFFQTPSQKRFIYEEFLKFQLLIQKKRSTLTKDHSPSIPFESGISITQGLCKKLPFQLTSAQDSVLREILLDLSQPHSMNRLVQGDVGSGKTAVALLSAGTLIADGYQVALMAPTEILARQHFKTACDYFQNEFRPALLIGSTKSAERLEIQRRLDKKEPFLLIGTHALIEDQIQFTRLGLAIIDEQHRFGVEQRARLRIKGAFKDLASKKTSAGPSHLLYPHTLVLTATPIPRSLALTIYGELDVSAIRELPKGRAPIQTKIYTDANEAKIFEFVNERLRAGEQAYVVFPLIETSEKEGFDQLRSAVQEGARIAETFFPQFICKTLHGQMKPDEKDAIMKDFKEGRVHVLCSTTVIEVGVDVPNATVMMIQNAERFGLAQLHQLRGRVGRGQKQGYCFLHTAKNSQGTASERLSILEKSTDGFVLAEKDLELRGPGDFLGTRQTGLLPFKYAELSRDSAWLYKAKDDALRLFQSDPEFLLPEHQGLRRFLFSEVKGRDEYLKTL